MRNALIAILVVACAEPPASAPREHARPAAHAREDAGTRIAPPPPEWPAPTVEVSVDRLSGTHALAIALDREHASAHVEVRTARGPVPPDCASGRPADVIVDGAMRRVEGLDRADSVAVCVKDDEGRVRARAEVPGLRTVRRGDMLMRDARGLFVDLTVEPLDDDVVSLAYVAGADGGSGLEDRRFPDPRRCTVELGYDSDEDAPVECVYECSGRVALEIPRATMETLLGSVAYRSASEDGDILYPSTLGLRVPIALREGEDGVLPCVRTKSGVLETGVALEHTAFDEVWYDCYDTPSGACTYGSDLVREGDVLLGMTASGARVQARVRSVEPRTGVARTVRAGGSSFEVAADELVRGTDGRDIVAGDLEVGMRLARADQQPASITAIDDHDWSPDTPRPDLEGATYYLRRGFAIRDAGDPAEPPGGIAIAPASFEIHPGRGDCSVEARWIASMTPHEVTLSVRPFTSEPRFSRTPAQCDSRLRVIDTQALSAVASLDPRAEIVMQLFGDGIECDSAYAVSLCEGASAREPALWALASPYCLPAGTMIETAQGPRPIEKLMRGEALISYDPGRGETSARVIDLFTHRDRELLEIVLDDGTALEATPEHVLLVGERFALRTARTLQAGEQLSVRTPDGLELHTILAVEPSRRADVYELRVTSPDTYFANGVLVHNY